VHRETQPRLRQLTGGRESQVSEAITGAVLDLLESGGYDAVQLREVARLARVSLATVYKLFPTRDALIVAGVQRWMAADSYSEPGPPPAGETLYDGLMRIFRHVFEPWERSPHMLAAYHRARTGPGGERLDLQGIAAIEPAARAVLAGADPDYRDDIETILTNMAYALTGRCADGTLDITAILPALERLVFRLTTNNEPAAAAARTRRSRT